MRKAVIKLIDVLYENGAFSSERLLFSSILQLTPIANITRLKGMIIVVTFGVKLEKVFFVFFILYGVYLAYRFYSNN